MPREEEEQKITKQFVLEHTDEDETDLSLCNLSKVPVKELALVPRGVKLDLSQNKLTQLPDNFVSLKHLVELDLSKNQLLELPHNFGSLLQLQRLDLYGNQLRVLPLSFSQLKKLKWLDVRNNRLEDELAKVAGDCLSDQECKQCAINVVKFMKERTAEEERKRQRELERQREIQRQREQEQQDKIMEARQRKAKEKQRRREEWQRKKSKEEEEAQALKERDAKLMDQGDTPSAQGKRSESRRGWRRCVCTILLLPLLLVVAMVTVQLLLMEHPLEELQAVISRLKHNLLKPGLTER